MGCGSREAERFLFDFDLDRLLRFGVLDFFDLDLLLRSLCFFWTLSLILPYIEGFMILAFL